MKCLKKVTADHKGNNSWDILGLGLLLVLVPLAISRAAMQKDRINKSKTIRLRCIG